VEEFIIDIGEAVVCDICNADYSESDESGGILLGSYAICPACEPKLNASDIDAECPAGVSFKDWVLSLRNGDNTIRITSEQ
jgi:hypothetical protein